jgi:hypothetical protein
MIRHTLVLAVAAALVGCEASARVGGEEGARTTPTQATQLAAFAASPDNQFPSDAQASDDLRAAAIVSRDGGTIKIYNFTNDPIQNAKVWVNGEYVNQVSRIPAQGSTTLNRSQFYNKNGISLANNKVPVQRVQVQSGDTLSNLQGPVFE